MQLFSSRLIQLISLMLLPAFILITILQGDLLAQEITQIQKLDQMTLEGKDFNNKLLECKQSLDEINNKIIAIANKDQNREIEVAKKAQQLADDPNSQAEHSSQILRMKQDLDARYQERQAEISLLESKRNAKHKECLELSCKARKYMFEKLNTIETKNIRSDLKLELERKLKELKMELAECPNLNN